MLNEICIFCSRFLENDNTNEDGVDDKLLVEEDNEVEARDTLYSHRFEELDHEFVSPLYQ